MKKCYVIFFKIYVVFLDDIYIRIIYFDKLFYLETTNIYDNNPKISKYNWNYTLFIMKLNSKL